MAYIGSLMRKQLKEIGRKGDEKCWGVDRKIIDNGQMQGETW